MSDKPDTRPEAEMESAPEPRSETSSPGVPSVQQAVDFIKRFELPERLLLIGSCCAFVLGLFSWYSLTTMFGGWSINGFAGAGWVFGISSLTTVALLLVPTLHKAVLGSLTQKTVKLVFLGLAAATLVFGPLRFLLSISGGDSPSMMNLPTGSSEMFSAGKTLWFWLALLASGAAMAGAFLSLRKQIR